MNDKVISDDPDRDDLYDEDGNFVNMDMMVEGVKEHIHAGYEYWHRTDILHFGCRRVEDGEVTDSVICSFSTCEHFDNQDVCLDMMRERGMTDRDYFSHREIDGGYGI